MRAAVLVFAIGCGRVGFDAYEPVAMCGGVPIEQLYLGHRSTCFLSTGGSRWCIGEDDGEPAGATFPAHLPGDDGWTSLALGYAVNVGVQNGAIAGWTGNNSPALVMSDATWAQIATGLSQVCYRRATGELVCDGQAIPGAWQDIATGYRSYCGVHTDGSLWCWGIDDGNMLGQGVEADGTVQAAPLQIGTATTWREVHIGDRLACAQRSDGTLWCWGGPSNTGTNGGDTMGVPTQIAPDTDWAWFAVHWAHACAGKPDGRVFCWGNDTWGLAVVPGVPFGTPVLAPTLIATFDAFLMGGHHYCARRAGVWSCWGWNAAGQLGIGTTTSHDAATVPLCTLGT